MKIYFRKEYVLPVIKAHAPRLFITGIRAKDLKQIAKKMGFTAKSRGTYEQKLNRLVKDGVLKDSGTKEEGCTVFALAYKTIVRDVKGMRVMPRKLIKAAQKRAEARMEKAVATGDVMVAAAGLTLAEIKTRRLEAGKKAVYHQNRSKFYSDVAKALYALE